MNKEQIIKTEKKVNGVKMAEFDVNKIVKKAQESYDKKDAGLAKQLATGTSLVRPSRDEDFIVWTYNNFWQELTGIKGIPFGRIVQIAGKSDSGKTSVGMAYLVAAQQQGVLGILWDSEKKFNASRFTAMGGDCEKLLVCDTNNIINGAKAVAHFVNSAKEQYPDIKILILWDSVGASVNSSEDSEENEDMSKQPGISAKEVAFTIRKFNKLSNKYINRKTGEDTIATLVINQTYVSIGMGAPTQIEKGGTELTYLSSVIMQLSRKKDLTRVKDGQAYKYGIVSRAKVKKNHLANAQEIVAEMDICVSANGVQLAKDVQSYTDIQGWDDKSEDDGDE